MHEVMTMVVMVTLIMAMVAISMVVMAVRIIALANKLTSDRASQNCLAHLRGGELVE